MTSTVPPPPSAPPPATEAAPAPTRSPSEPQGLLDRWSDPTWMLVATAVFSVLALLPWAIRAPFTLPVALFLPGHALLAALDRPDRVLPSGARFAARIVLSMAVVSLVVLGIGWLLEVDRFSVVAGIWLVTSMSALFAWNRDLPTREASAGPRWTQSGVMLAATAAIAVVVVFVGLLILPQPREPAYSSLAFAGTTKTSGSPIVVSSGRTAEVTVAVENGTRKTVTYRVIPALDGGAAWDAPKVRLRPGERKTVEAKGKIPADACLTRLTVALSADGKGSGVPPLVTYIRNEAGDACG